MTIYEDTSNQIINQICKSGGKAYLVGGAVRDEFLGLDPDDFDIVTDLTPQELQDLFYDRNIKLVGANFLVTMIDNIEVATYRSDYNTGPGRFNCVATACKTLGEDLSRRDFTFNALAICPYTGEVIDLFDGRKDLQNKVVKFIGNPNERIYEDPLRMLRAARFAALINGILDQETKESIITNKILINQVSPERIRLELLKVMKYNKPSVFFNILHETGLLDIILTELETSFGHPGGKYHSETIDTHILLTGDHMSYKKPVLRLIGYMHDIGKVPAWIMNKGESFIDHELIGSHIIEGIFKKYKFTTHEIEQAIGLVLLHMRSTKDMTKKATRKLLKALSERNISWRDWLHLKIADRKANLGREDYTREEIKEICLKIFRASHETISGEFKLSDLVVDGNDVMEILNIKPSRKVGEVLDHLMEIVLDDPENNRKEILFKEIEKFK